jgi:D-alanyl-D-alanine carboxypeptidase/D-alanyl-D-alanine-endopeptidase (penicillin-binding protein 4)
MTVASVKRRERDWKIERRSVNVGKNMRDSKTCQFFALFLSFVIPSFALTGSASPSSLNERIAYILKQNGLAGSGMSIKIVSIPDGRVLYEKNSGQALNPASNIKLITMATALRELGPSYTFPTEFYSDTLIGKDGKINHLWIKGYGDPLFVTEELEDLVRRFKAAGLKRIDGQIYVDDTYFDRYGLTTYIADVNEKLYSIMTGPLSFNFNSIKIRAKPARRLGEKPMITLEPPTQYVSVENEAKTAWVGASAELDAEVRQERPPSAKKKEEREKNVIRIRGTIPRTIREYEFRRGVPDPAVYTGTVILEALQRHGIAIKGGLRREAVPENALLLFSHSSKPLREILKSLGKFSNNFTAEQLVKTIAAKHFGPPGSIPKGLKVLREYLESLGVSKKDFVLDNGSGLTRLSRVSASDFIRLLHDIYVSPWRDDFIAALSVGGVDGTLARKFKGGRVTGKMHAKTGTLNDVKALSGYVFDRKARIAFSFLFNDFGEAVPMDNIARAEEEILETVLDSF